MDFDEQQENRSRKSDRVTQRLCRFVACNSGQCYGDAAWLLEDTDHDENGFYVCDAHLSAGVRMIGLPARIEAPSAIVVEKKIKARSNCKPLSSTKRLY